MIRYGSTKAVAPGWVRTDPGAGFPVHYVDGVRPFLVSADILANGTDLELRWDDTLDEDSVPTRSDPGFNVLDTVGNASRGISAISVRGRVVTLTLSSTVSTTDRLSVSYDIPSSNRIKDAVGNYAADTSTTVSITQNPNSPPQFYAGEDGARSVDENTPARRNIGSPISATDTNGDRLTYSISGTDAAFFDVAVNRGGLLVKDALDYESRDSYSFTMSVHDGKDVHGNADTTIDDTITVTVTVGDVDEPPVITGMTTIGNYDENGSGDVAAFTAADPEGITAFTWSLGGPDSGDFDITGGVLTFKNPPDYERPADSGGDNRYEVAIQATDSTNQRGELHVDVIVANLDEPGAVEANVAEPRVGQTLRLNVEDEDGGVNVREWKWERGDPNGSCGTVANPTITTRETISGAGSSRYTPTAADLGHCIRATAFYDDRAGTGRFEHFLTPNPVEVGPFFSQDPPTYRVRENTAEGRDIGRVPAHHSNSGEALTYRLNGADASYFAIGNNGQLKTSATPLDYETQPGREVAAEITAEDNNGQTATIAVTITVTDECTSAGEPPCAPGRPSVRSASDTGLRVTWSTPGTPSGTSITGYDLQYRESDSGGSWIPRSIAGTGRSQTIGTLIKDRTYEVRVRAMNESNEYGEWSESGTGTPGGFPPPPPGLVFPEGVATTRSVAENDPAGTAIGLPVAASDANGAMLTYTLGGPDVEYFDIVESTGQLEVGDETVLDHEARSGYTVEVAAANDSGATAVITVAVMVINVDEEGTLSLSPDRPSVDTPVSAALSDPDRDISDVTWRWARDRAMGGTFDNIISGARGKSYTPVAADIDMYLKATARYTDAHGAGKNANAVSDHAVTDGDPLVARYDGNGNGMIDKVEVIKAMNDYLFGGGDEAISKAEVIELINLYLFG